MVLGEEGVTVVIPIRLLGLVVDFAVQFDDQPGFVAVEVRDERSELMLTSKLETEYFAPA